MAIDFACDACGQRYQISEQNAGRSFRCRKCQKPLTVPGSPPAARPASRPPLQTFGAEGAKPASRPPLQSFGSTEAGPKPRPAVQSYGAGGAAAPPPQAAPPPDDVYGLTEDDGGDPYDVAVEPLPARGPSGSDEDNPYAAPRATSKPRKRKKKGDYASVWKRWVASVADGIILGVIRTGVVLLAGVMFRSDGEAPNPTLIAMVQLASLSINVLYEAILESSSKQATFGKMAMGLIVTDLDGRQLTFGKALARALAKILSALICFIGYLMAIWDDRRQALHDKIVGTYVIDAR